MVVGCVCVWCLPLLFHYPHLCTTTKYNVMINGPLHSVFSGLCYYIHYIVIYSTVIYYRNTIRPCTTQNANGSVATTDIAITATTTTLIRFVCVNDFQNEMERGGCAPCENRRCVYVEYSKCTNTSYKFIDIN